MEWKKWEDKILIYGAVEAKISKALEKKLLGKCLADYFAVLIMHTFSDVEDECTTARALMELEHMLYARSTKNKKKILHYHNQVHAYT